MKKVRGGKPGNLLKGIDRDPTRDSCIKEFIKRKWSSGLFFAVGAAEKKIPTAISIQHFGVVF